MKTIDLTPTWKGVYRVLVEVAVNAETAEGAQSAYKELDRMAGAADAHNQYCKSLKEPQILQINLQEGYVMDYSNGATTVLAAYSKGGNKVIYNKPLLTGEDLKKVLNKLKEHHLIDGGNPVKLVQTDSFGVSFFSHNSMKSELV